jgi:HD-like signal output (HDOD) protein
MAKEIAVNPENWEESEDEDETGSGRTSTDTFKPLTPLELLVNEIKLPALPQVLLELLRVINDPKSSAEDLAQVISLDTGLSSYLLRMVNSAYYSFPFPIDTVARAVTLIGTRELSVLAFSTSFLKMFKESPPKYLKIEDFWKHSIACGITARNIARRCGKKNPDRHFVAGLLHDIGRLVIFSNLPELGLEVLTVANEKDILVFEAESSVLGFDHARFGGALMGKWNLPATLVSSVRYHHSPQEGEDFEEPGSIHIADIVTKSLGIGLSGQLYVPPLDAQVWEDFGLTPEGLDHVIDDLEGEIEKTFGLLMGLEGFHLRKQ